MLLENKAPAVPVAPMHGPDSRTLGERDVDATTATLRRLGRGLRRSRRERRARWNKIGHRELQLLDFLL